MRSRVSIGWVLILWLGIGVGALWDPTDWWSSALFTGTLLVLAFAALFAVYRRGPRQAFWSAFVAFGSGYLVLVFGPWCETAVRPRLLTTKLLAAAYRSASLPARTVGAAPPGGIPRRGDSGTKRSRNFEENGHLLFALFLAGSAGMAARRFYVHRDERRKEAVEKAAGVMLKVLEAGL